MQIFATHPSPDKAAKFLWDTNPVRARKMITETMQILACCQTINNHNPNLLIRKLDGTPFSTPKSRLNHPIVKWAASNPSNIKWLVHHLYHLHSHYVGIKFQNVKSNIALLQQTGVMDYSPILFNEEFLNFAKANDKGLDFTYISNTFKAYRKFIRVQETNKI